MAEESKFVPNTKQIFEEHLIMLANVSLNCAQIHELPALTTAMIETALTLQKIGEFEEDSPCTDEPVQEESLESLLIENIRHDVHTLGTLIAKKHSIETSEFSILFKIGIHAVQGIPFEREYYERMLEPSCSDQSS